MDEEFDCIECGRHIIRLCAPAGEPKLCAACIMLPGWNTNPLMREIIDPEHEAVWPNYSPDPPRRGIGW